LEKTVLLGLVSHKPRWGLSTRGWLIGLLVVVAGAIGATCAVQPFLAITARTNAEFLVVEGWVDDHAIFAALKEYQAGRYHETFATGGPMLVFGSFFNEFSSSAALTAHRLRRAGVPAEHVHSVPTPSVERDRTYSSALALRGWFRNQHIVVTRLDVLTEDVHARRTRLLFEKAFGPSVQIGVIAVPSPEYRAQRWWHYSKGVRDVLGECIAYLYARLFFHPPSSSAADSTLLPAS
jgi:uncharacterized SAM-binding protein YcdF (DUF218 family)